LQKLKSDYLKSGFIHIAFKVIIVSALFYASREFVIQVIDYDMWPIIVQLMIVIDYDMWPIIVQLNLILFRNRQAYKITMF
jgi:hypothetical protein